MVKPQKETKKEINPDWKNIFKNLEKWRKEILSLPGAENTAIEAVASECRPDNEKAWAVLVSTIISLRTKDDVTRVASKRLLEKAPNPKKLLKLKTEEIENLIYPAGFYHTKTKSLKSIAVILIEKYDGLVPADMEKLLSLPGVGRKTANLVLTEAFNMYGICVDIHVHRICNRAGWLESKTPEKTEIRLREILPKSFWKRINGLLVFYGQNICRPVSPFCSRCVISDFCEKKGIYRKR